LFVKRGQKPEYWDELSEEEKVLQQDLINIIVDFFNDIKRQGIYNIAFGSYAMPEQSISNRNFLNILEDQNKIYGSTNMLIRISSNEGGAREFSKRNSDVMTDEELSYLYLSQLGWTLLQTVELFRNTLLKTIDGSSLRHRNGRPVRNPEKYGLGRLLDILAQYSDKAEDIKRSILRKP